MLSVVGFDVDLLFWRRFFACGFWGSLHGRFLRSFFCGFLCCFGRWFGFLSGDDVGEEGLGFFEFGVAGCGGIFSGAVYVEVEHAHAGGGVFWREFFWG